MYAAFLLCAIALSPAPARAQTAADTAAVAPEPPQRVPVAIGETILINVIVNLFNRATHAEPDQFYVTPESWSYNLRKGFEWDDNTFQTNQFAHPYHGGTYFNAGRSNGLDFWESAPLSALGSLTWEYLGEKHRPSLNDFINTTVGGIALGEMFHRIATSIRDNEATGTERILREIAAAPIDPVGGFNRLIRGEAGRVGPNPADHRPPAIGTNFQVGMLARDSKDETIEDDNFGAYFDFEVAHGRLFQTDFEKPFEVFALRVQGSVADTGALNLLRGEGSIYGKKLGWSEVNEHQWMITQNFDYVSNNAFELGGQSIEGSLASRFHVGERARLTTRIGGRAILIGAVSSEVQGLTYRDYDFGPGLGARGSVRWDRGGMTYVRASLLSMFIDTVAGSDAMHIINSGVLEGQAALTRRVALGASSFYYRRDSHYPGDVHTKQDTPEFRAYVAWNPQNPQ